jgi:hypothetical protein
MTVLGFVRQPGSCSGLGLAGRPNRRFSATAGEDAGRYERAEKGFSAQRVGRDATG